MESELDGYLMGGIRMFEFLGSDAYTKRILSCDSNFKGIILSLFCCWKMPQQINEKLMTLFTTVPF